MIILVVVVVTVTVVGVVGVKVLMWVAGLGNAVGEVFVIEMWTGMGLIEVENELVFFAPVPGFVDA